MAVLYLYRGTYEYNQYLYCTVGLLVFLQYIQYKYEYGGTVVQ